VRLSTLFSGLDFWLGVGGFDFLVFGFSKLSLRF